MLPIEHRSPVPQPYFRHLEFPPSPVPCLPLEEAMAEKLRALQQRATERDLYDVVQYSRRKVPPELTRLLAVAKMWSVREPYSGHDLLETLRTGRRDWPDLNLLLPRSRQRDWNAECRGAADRLAYLAETTPFDCAVIEDSRRHHLAKPLHERIRSLASRALAT